MKRELTADLDIQWHSPFLLVHSHQVHHPRDVKMFVLELHGYNLRLLGIGRQAWKVLIGVFHPPVIRWGHQYSYRYTRGAKISCFTDLVASIRCECIVVEDHTRKWTWQLPEFRWNQAIFQYA